MKECRKRERNYAKEPIRNSDLRSIVTEIKKKNVLEAQVAHLSWQKEESEKLKKGQLRVSSLRTRNEKG